MTLGSWTAGLLDGSRAALGAIVDTEERQKQKKKLTFKSVHQLSCSDPHRASSKVISSRGWLMQIMEIVKSTQLA
jgi:hypothetical protein